MASLPVPGSDAGIWANELNTWLLVAHNPDGTLITSAVGNAAGLHPTGVKTAAYTAVPNDFVPVDTTSGSVTITLPTNPADQTRIAVKMIKQGGTNKVTINSGGADVFNVSLGLTSLTLGLLFQGVILQYAIVPGIWYVQADDLPLGQLAPNLSTSRYRITSNGTTVVAYDQTGSIVYSGADAGAAVTACLPAANTAGATIDFRNDGSIFPWSSVPALPKGITSKLLIRGNGSTVQLSAAGPRFLDLHRIADYDTFQNIEVGGFVIDCNNIDVAQHVLFGNRDGTATPDQRVNIQQIHLHDLKAINVPYTAGNRSCISLSCHHLASGETQTNLTDILIERVRCEGGTFFIAITGGVSPFSAATPVNVFYDNITIRDCYYTSAASRALGSGGGIQIGQNAYGDRVTIQNCELDYCCDIIVELDACQNGWVENVRGRDNAGGGFLVTNFRAPINTATQHITFLGCKVKQTDQTNAAGSTFAISMNNSIPIGNIIYENCHVYKNYTEVKNNIGIMLEAATGSPQIRSIMFDKCSVVHEGLSTTLGGNLFGIHLQSVAGQSGACEVKIRNCRFRYNGAYTSGAFAALECLTVMNAGANVQFDINGFDVDVNVSGYGATFATNAIAFNRSGGYTVGGTIRRLRIISLGSDTGAQAVAVGATSSVTISPSPLRVTDCDFSAMNASRELRLDATNQANVVADRNRWRTASYGSFKTVTSAYTVAYPQDGTVCANSAGALTVTLLDATTVPAGTQFTIKNINTGVVTIATTASQTIDGATSYSLPTQYQALTVISNGTNWNIL